jgi:NAD+ synthase (glutamine-hydrolysing)
MAGSLRRRHAMSRMRVALAQINPTVGDLDGNAGLIAGAVERAKKKEADLVCFPELALSGCPPEGLAQRPGFLADCRRALEEVARRTEGIVSVVGLPDRRGDGVANAAASLGGGVILGTYAGRKLSRRGESDDGSRFLPRDGGYAFETKGVRCLLTVSDDVRAADEEIERDGRDADVVLNLSASSFQAGRLPDRRDSLADFAKRTRTFVCQCNLVGGQDELVFDGGSVIVSPEGEVVAEAARFEEDLLVADITVYAGSAAAGECRLVTPSGPPELGALEEIRRALVLGTRDYARKNGFTEAVIGLSGGIDSSLVAAIAVEALGRGSVVGVTMPSRFNSQETISDAERLARNLGARFLTVPIEPVFEAFRRTLEPVFAEGGDDAGGPSRSATTMENLQARIRGVILMALSNRFGWLVLAGGNRSEAAVGYCTLYGDTVGGFAPIKHVPKTLVRELANHVNDSAGREIIPASVVARPPSAELRAGQKDEDSLPPYEVLDRVLEGYLDRGKAPDEIAGPGIGEDLVRDVIRMVHGSEFKRRQLPPGVMIASGASRAGRLPITNRYL